MSAEYTYIGKSVPRNDALRKVTGEATYAGDIQLPGALCGKIKTSPYPFARIAKVNCEKARRLPGVKAAISGHDVTQFPFGPRVVDELALAHPYARYIGEAVAAVAATDPDIAEEALDLIEVEYEEMTPVMTAEKAKEPGSPLVHPEKEDIKQNTPWRIDFVRGEGEAAFANADLVLEDRFTTQTVHHAYIEPQASVAEWDSSGRVTVQGCTQSVTVTRRLVAMALGIPETRVRIIQPYVGGGFGGKMWLLTPYIISAFLAKAAGRPVKVVYTREEDFISGRPRVSEVIDLRMGFKKDGMMVAKSSNILADIGAYTGLCPNVVLMSATRPDNVYRLPNIKLHADLVYTNTIPRGSFRGFGNPQMQFAMESMVSMAAEKLGIDPVEIRLKNCVQKGDTTVHGWQLRSCGLDKTIKLTASESDWKAKQHKIAPNHGIGIACQAHVAGHRAVHPLYDGSAAVINVNQDGRARIVSGETDLGQGMTTVFAQIAAEALGMKIEDIDVEQFTDSDTAPFCHGTYADRVTVLGGNAVLKAARDARRQLLGHAARKLGVKVTTLNLKESKFYDKKSNKELATLKEIAYDTVLKKQAGVPITGRGDYKVPSYVVVPDLSSYGNYSLSYTFGTAMAEVSVDPDTGKVDVIDFWYSLNVGKALNPRICEGQMEGGVMQGIGYALTEDYIWNKEGKLLNPSFTDYKIPLVQSTPHIHCLWVQQPNPGSPFGAKGVGEPVLNPIAPAIANAVYNAVGVRITDMPITPEKILKALKAKKG